MISVRRQLLVSLLLALLVVSLLIALLTLRSARHEINELYDASLSQLAAVLERQLAGELRIGSRVGDAVQPPDSIREEQEFLIQLWNDRHQLVYTSHPAIALPLQSQLGLHSMHFNGELWRAYRSDSAAGSIQVSQPRAVRHEPLEEIVSRILLPLLLQLPLLGLLIWVAVGRSLRPLTALSAAIRARNYRMLSLLPLQNVPTEIQPLVMSLNSLLEQLDRALQLQRQFTADAAHELRTPLTALQLQLALLARAQSPAERDSALQQLAAGITRGIRLVQQLLTIARLEPDGEQAPAQTVALHELAKSVVEQFLPLAEEKKIDLGFARLEPATASGDFERLHLLLGNLIDNAIRYTPAGGRVDVTVYTEGQQAILQVNDSGIGIPVAERERIFDRFHRVAENTAMSAGTGLGLAIVKSVAEQCGARITVGDGLDTVQSNGTSGRGSSFTVVFPAVAANAA
jgi:two-component system, OmpR family, sensor kinase